MPQTWTAWSGLGRGLLHGTARHAAVFFPVLGQTGEMWAILTGAGTCPSELHDIKHVALLPASSP